MTFFKILFMTFDSQFQSLRQHFSELKNRITDRATRSRLGLFVAVIIGVILSIMLLLMLWWGHTPAAFSVNDEARAQAALRQRVMTSAVRNHNRLKMKT